jgi:NAD(P)H-nitrite reductase large subunit
MDNREDIICRCEEITRGEIIDAIQKGDISLDSIKRRTRAGMGFCQGKTCARLVAQIIAEETGKGMSEIKPSYKRPPAGPIPILVLAQET